MVDLVGGGARATLQPGSGAAAVLCDLPFLPHVCAALRGEPREPGRDRGFAFRNHRSTVAALDAKDPETRGHLGRVRIYAVELAREMGVRGRELECLQAAALLHDIGKLALPEGISFKPGKLTPDEFEKVKAHPLVGAEILEWAGLDPMVPAIVRAHHERWDGSGYPDGLGGDQIPLGAQILSAVDALDALSSDRRYRKALPLGEAMREVSVHAGASFDPEVVDLLALRYEELECKVARQASPGADLSLDVRVERATEPAAGNST
ncbi:MAG: HD-GYP domain-containing protein [Bryobacteraceae bacterium]